MATVPLSGTNIRLLSGVPFSNDYKHTRWFDTLSQQTTYFNGKTRVHSIVEANFQRIEGRNFVAVNKSIDELWGTNYLMFQNTHYNSKWFYAFVTKLEYVQRNTTYVHFEIDVFQTWKFEMNFKPSYVVREHCRLWNSDGTPVINTVDEGLDYGKEYDIVRVNQYHPTNSILFLVIVSKSTLHIPDGYPSANYIKSTINGGAQPLSVYIHPFDLFGNTPEFWDGETMRTDFLKDGNGNLILDQFDQPIPIQVPDVELSSLRNLLNQIYSLASSVNNIVSMYITDHCGIDWNYSGNRLTANSGFFQTLKTVKIDGSQLKTIYVEENMVYKSTPITCNRKYMDFGGVYGGTLSFPNITESKLLMHPYSLTVLDDFKGNRTTIKNEFVQGDSLQLEVLGSMGVSNKVAYVPKNYLTEKLISDVDRSRVGIENAVVDVTAHDVSIINDMLAAFLQGHKNTMKNQADVIAFNGIADMFGSLIGGIGSASAGNALGVAGSGVGVVKGGGNAVLQLQGMQAKLKDINNQPPSMSKMGSNTAFEYGNGYYGVWAIAKQIKPEYMKKLSDFFKMFGYKMNEVKMPNFHTRQNWNYVQTNSCNIIGNFNNEDLQELKQVFDNGITFWHTDDVGNYSLPNGVIA